MPRPRSVNNRSIVFYLVDWIGLYLFNYMENFVRQKTHNFVLPAEIYFEAFQFFYDLTFFGDALRC